MAKIASPPVHIRNGKELRLWYRRNKIDETIPADWMDRPEVEVKDIPKLPLPSASSTPSSFRPMSNEESEFLREYLDWLRGSFNT